MKKLLVSLLIVGIAACSAGADDKNQIRVQLQIFRLRSDLPGKTHVDEPIWTTDDTPSKWKNKVEVFSRGQFEVGKNKLEFKDGRCFWNNKKMPISGRLDLKLPADLIRLIYSPDIVMKEHGSRKYKIESMQPIQYFERREDGLFELKEVELATGLDIEITEATEDENKGYIELEDLVMTMRSVVKRKKIEGVSLPVGLPVLAEEEYDFYFRVRPGKDYGILIRPGRGHGGLLIRLRASSTASGTYDGKKDKKE